MSALWKNDKDLRRSTWATENINSTNAVFNAALRKEKNMELKDWVTLFVPILFNGIILFGFQQVFLCRNKKTEQLNTYKRDVYMQFIELLQEFYSRWRDITDLNWSDQEYAFASLWNPVQAMVDQLVVFIDTHPVTIGSAKVSFTECMDEFDAISDLLRNDLINNDARISQASAEEFCRRYEIVIQKTKDSLAVCENEILNCMD